MEKTILTEVIEDFLKNVPTTKDVIGYGSKVKEQSNSKTNSKTNIDIIATVDNDYFWHRENKHLNPQQYSILSHISNIPTAHFGTDISYLANIKYKDNIFKLGIINRQDLIEDLTNWKNFFLAGRLQKSILEIKTDPNLEEAIKQNRINALKIALILNYGKQITEYDLLYTICDLSFKDDIRMLYKMENPNKIKNIINSSYNELSSIYNGINENLFLLKDGIIVPNYSFIIKHIEELPKNLFLYLLDNSNSIEDLKELKTLIEVFLKKQILLTSTIQPVKSILLNPISKSSDYAFQKHLKYKQK